MPSADPRVADGRAGVLGRFFQATGYVRVAEAIPEPLVDALGEIVDDHFDRAVHPFRTNPSGRICRLDDLLARDPLFLEVLQSPQILGPLEDLLGPNVEVSRHRHNHATLNRVGDIPFRLHRDIQQWSRPLLSVFIYLEEATGENGCTHIVPGSHLLPYPGPQSGEGGGNWADEHELFEPLIGQELPVPMPRGGVLLMSSLAFHSVGRNQTKGTRKSLVFACHSADELIEGSYAESTLLVAGQRKFKGNPALHVSGSLELSKN